ncbi:hypothetical protein Rhal01_03318 [Rubritalea halochordaticola]|uniref:Uncharacterized protein n=1 Tax=Rubritalea halochordaticola TaxID=714537 RepID=A0ABP9V3M1_9BACT
MLLILMLVVYRVMTIGYAYTAVVLDDIQKAVMLCLVVSSVGRK